MLNHVEIQGKITGETKLGPNGVRFSISHQRSFSNISDSLLCVIENGSEAESFLRNAKQGRTVIVNGKIRVEDKCVEILADSVHFVDGGG